MGQSHLWCWLYSKRLKKFAKIKMIHDVILYFFFFLKKTSNWWIRIIYVLLYWKLQDCLSENDRKRLHLFLGDDVPRRIRDDPTLSRTFNLIQSLFNQDKINAYDFNFLIKAFDEIQCVDAVKLLKGSLSFYFLINMLLYIFV
jgi:hypothetical protein